MIRFFSSIARPIGENIMNDVKPFSAMPGPKGILGIGSFYLYMKLFGEYNTFLNMFAKINQAIISRQKIRSLRASSQWYEELS